MLSIKHGTIALIAFDFGIKDKEAHGTLLNSVQVLRGYVQERRSMSPVPRQVSPSQATLPSYHARADTAPPHPRSALPQTPRATVWGRPAREGWEMSVAHAAPGAPCTLRPGGALGPPATPCTPAEQWQLAPGLVAYVAQPFERASRWRHDHSARLPFLPVAGRINPFPSCLCVCLSACLLGSGCLFLSQIAMADMQENMKTGQDQHNCAVSNSADPKNMQELTTYVSNP